jgi:hypothetical protein
VTVVLDQLHGDPLAGADHELLGPDDDLHGAVALDRQWHGADGGVGHRAVGPAGYEVGVADE